MNFQKGYINKICSFYAGDCHLVTMTLPYLSKKIRQKANIEVFLGENIKKYLNKLLDNLSLEEDVKDNIKKINWNDYELLKNNADIDLMSKLDENRENIFFINEERNNQTNAVLNNIIRTNSDYIIQNNIKLNVIYCYNIEKLKSIEHIVSQYEYVLNTSGIHKIKDVFQFDKFKMNMEQQVLKNKFVV